MNTDVRLLAESVKSLRGSVSAQDKELRDVGSKLGRYGVLVNIAWGIVLVVITVLLTILATKK